MTFTRVVTRMVISCFLLYACVYVLFIENHLPDAVIVFASTPTCDIREVGVSYNYYGIRTTWNNDTLVGITIGFVLIQLLSHRFIKDSYIRLIPSTGVLIGVAMSSYGEIYRLISALSDNQVLQKTISHCGSHRGEVVDMTYTVNWKMAVVLLASVFTAVMLFMIHMVSAIRRLRSKTGVQVVQEPIRSIV